MKWEVNTGVADQIDQSAVPTQKRTFANLISNVCALAAISCQTACCEKGSDKLLK